jgi:predicted phosphodiesterase
MSNSKAKKESQQLEYIDNLIVGMIKISRHDPEILKKLTKDQFQNKIIISGSLPISFTELKKRAAYELEQIGFSYPSIKKYTEGTYIIVGDTHGKHTRTGMFGLLKNLNKHLNATNIIHVGHFVDDDNDVNYNWEDFSNLTIIAKEEELKTIAEQKLKHEIVRKEILLGNKLTIANQDLLGDYVNTPLIRGIIPEFFENNTITNLHRHEMDTRCTESGVFSCVSSPGCLCEQHIVTTIKQQDFTDGRTVKMTMPSGYKKYRRMQHQYKTWQQGIIIVHVDKQGDFSIVMCRIYKTSKGFTTSYFDKIITETEILDPDEKSFINSDIHSKLHDVNILDIQEQIVKDYKPDIVSCLGDITDNHSLNHHIFSKNNSMRICDSSILNESAGVNYLLAKMSKWAKRKILLLGNHERFMQDMIDKLPQFSEILNFKFICNLHDLGFEVIEVDQTKKIANVIYSHGNIKMFGQTGGNRLDKIFRTYGRNVIMGHTHSPACRNDCYTVGLTGKLNLEYNEINASRWTHGCALSNSFEDVAFVSNIIIVNNKTILNKKCYKPINPNSWLIPKFKAVLEYKFA